MRHELLLVALLAVPPLLAQQRDFLTGDETDQVADPSILVVGATAYMFYAGVDNTAETGVILLATAPATAA